MRDRIATPFSLAVLAVVLFAARLGLAQESGTPDTDASATPEAPAGPPPQASPAPVDLPLEQTPYRVHIAIGFGDHPSLGPAFRRGVLEDVERLADRTAGQMWDLTVEDSRALRPAERSGLERLDPQRIRSPEDVVVPHRSYFITVALAGARYKLAARCWDGVAGQFGPVATAETFDRRDVGAAALRLVEELFRPVLVVDQLVEETGKLHLRLQAGELAAVADDSGPLRRQLAPGDLLVPLFRYLDKERVVQRVQFLPWTYLVVESVQRGNVVCEVVSGVRVPLGTSHRKSVESLAVAVRPSYEATRLQVLPQAQPARPLVGHYVVVAPKLFARDEPMDDVVRLVSDRSGTVRVPADPERPLVWLYISSGSNLLARVPFVPGVADADSIEVPDDSLRLAVEGEIAQLKGQLVDLVAKRFTILSRARLFARQNDAARLEEQLAALQELPDAADFQQQLNAIRVPAVEAARRRNDRLAQRRIERLCSETADLIKRYLDPDKSRLIREQIEELRLDARD